eukprot:gene8227-9777_t
MAEEGDQLRWWELAREFIERLGAAHGGNVKAVFPDAGVAAMLKNRWPDAPFAIASLDDREPMSADDSLVVITCPDPPSLKATKGLADNATTQDIPVVMFNPRLASGDVGIGVSVRRMRSEFLSTFLTSYSIYPLTAPDGSVFRCFPNEWQVFLADPMAPGRYQLVAQRSARPAGEGLDNIIDDFFGVGAEGEDNEEGSAGAGLANVGKAMKSMQRFMKQLSQ